VGSEESQASSNPPGAQEQEYRRFYAVYWAKYNETGTLVASGGQHSPVIIWDMKNGSILKYIQNKSEVTYCV